MFSATSADRFDAQTLTRALSIAWELLRAADHPITQSASTGEIRERMAHRIRLSATSAIDEDELWAAALDEVQFEPEPTRSRTARLAQIWEMCASVA